MDEREEHRSHHSNDSSPRNQPSFKLVPGSAVPGLKIPSRLSRETIVINFLAASTPILKEAVELIRCLDGQLKEAIIATTSLESFALRNRFSKDHLKEQNASTDQQWRKDIALLYKICSEECDLVINTPLSLDGSIDVLDLFTSHCSIRPKHKAGKKHFNEGASISIEAFTELSDLEHLLSLNAYYLPGTGCPLPDQRSCFENLTSLLLKQAHIKEPLFLFLESVAQIEATIVKDVSNIVQHTLRIVQYHWSKAISIWPSQIFSKTLHEDKKTFLELLNNTQRWVKTDEYYKELRDTCRVDLFSSNESSDNEENDIALLGLLLFPIQNYAQCYGKAIPKTHSEATKQIKKSLVMAIDEITACAQNLHNQTQAYHVAATNIENEVRPLTQRTPRSGGRQGTPRSQPNSGRSNKDQPDLIQSPRRHSGRPNLKPLHGRLPSPNTRVRRSHSKDTELPEIIWRSKTPEEEREKTHGREQLRSSAPPNPSSQQHDADQTGFQPRTSSNRYSSLRNRRIRAHDSHPQQDTQPHHQPPSKLSQNTSKFEKNN